MKIQRKTMTAEVPSLAMGDIAFNLLIFFVILARAHDDSFLNWKPAAAKDLESAGHARVSVLIDTDAKLYLNGQEVGISQLSEMIRETPALRFEPVIEAISEAGGDMVHILEEQRE